jgi:mannose-6-phosphate isomerase
MTKTIFCDIDGTILKHKGDIFKNILEPPVLLENVLETFKQWDKNNFKVILTTGRKESYRAQTEEQLRSIGIPYDTLLMGLPNDNRIVINDKKERGIRNTAFAVNLVRNNGFRNMASILHNQDHIVSNKAAQPERIQKPWGYEELVEHNAHYVVKKLFMKKGHSCSTQYHELKTETITVLQGKLRIYVGSTLESLEAKEYNPGDSITITPYTVHKMEGIDDCLYLEASTPELWDVVRLQDNYGRA